MGNIVNSRPLKVGDKVEPSGYCGEMIIDHKDETGSLLVGENLWFCVSEEYDTSFETYSESDLKLIDDK